MSENSSVFNELRLEKQLCDAVIRVEEAEFYVHKIILCNCSQYFSALFTNWSAPNRRFFDIPDLLPDMAKLIIDFAYTGTLAVTEDNVKELFIAADRFAVMGILRACSSFIEKRLAPQNCISIWRFADTYYYPELKDKAFLFTLKHSEAVFATSEDFQSLSAQELLTIIEKDQLNVRQEETVYEAILHWISFAQEERKQQIALLLPKVRLALLSPDRIKAMIDSEIVRESKECQMILTDTLSVMLDLRIRTFPGSMLSHPLARPRLPSAILFTFGGWNSGTPCNVIETYDVRANCWDDISYDGDYCRAYHSTVFLDGYIYCIGGYDNDEHFNTVHRFDLSTHTWQEVAVMHSKRCYVSTTVLGGYIYAMGGFDGIQRHRTAERYQPGTNQWTLISPMHEQRSDACSTTLRGKVYICGGFTGVECLSTAEYYNPETNHWTLISPMKYSRSGVGVVAYAGHVIAVGGFDGHTRLRAAEAYDPNTDTWHDMPSMLGPRSNFGISVIDKRIFVVGGFSGFNTTSDVECYDAKTGVWSGIRHTQTSRSALSCSVVYGINNMTDYVIPRYLRRFFSDEDR